MMYRIYCLLDKFMINFRNILLHEFFVAVFKKDRFIDKVLAPPSLLTILVKEDITIMHLFVYTTPEGPGKPAGI